MFWIIGAIIYLVIGLGLSWMLSAAGGEKFSLNRYSIPFIITWPRLIFAMIFKN